MNMGKLFLIAGLVGAVALIGCSDDNGTGGTAGTAGTGGTGGTAGTAGAGGTGGASARVRVFVTSGTFNGNLGGLSDADTICTNAADAATLGGTWTAWLSLESAAPEEGVDAIGRISVGRYERLDGMVVADNKLVLTDGSLDAPINVREDGTEIPAQDNHRVWTGTNSEGTYLGNVSCNRWTSGDAADDGRTGLANAVDADWTDAGGAVDEVTCDNSYRLYCFEDIDP